MVCKHGDGLSVVVSAVGIKNRRKVTNLENMGHAAAHCRVGGTTSLLLTTRGDDVECPRVKAAVLHLCRHLDLQMQTELVGYSRTVYSTFSCIYNLITLQYKPVDCTNEIPFTCQYLTGQYILIYEDIT